MSAYNLSTLLISVLLLLASSAFAYKTSESHWLSNYYQCAKHLEGDQSQEKMAQSLEEIKRHIDAGSYGTQTPHYSNMVSFFENAKALWVHGRTGTTLLFVSEKAVLPVVLNEATRARVRRPHGSVSKTVGTHNIALNIPQYPIIYLSVYLGEGEGPGLINGLSVGQPSYGMRRSEYVFSSVPLLEERVLRLLVVKGVTGSVKNAVRPRPQHKSVSKAGIGIIPTSLVKSLFKPAKESLRACRSKLKSNRDLGLIMMLDHAILAAK